MAFVAVTLPNMAFAQEDSEDGIEEEEDTTVVGSVFAEARTNTTMSCQEVGRCEAIEDDGTISNPGGAGNENISLADDDITTPPTNLDQIVNPRTIETQTYIDLEVALRGAGYAMGDMQYAEDANGVSTIIVRGLEGVMEQPNEMDLNTEAARQGYYVDLHIPVDGAWLTIFKSVTGSP